jgi:hypothetical protein
VRNDFWRGALRLTAWKPAAAGRRKTSEEPDRVGVCSKTDLNDGRNIFYLNLDSDIYIEFNSRQQ